MNSVELAILLVGMLYLRRLILITRYWQSISESPAWELVSCLFVWLIVIGATSAFVGYVSYLLGRLKLLNYL